jgi:hypothetical protein
MDEMDELEAIIMSLLAKSLDKIAEAWADPGTEGAVWKNSPATTKLVSSAHRLIDMSDKAFWREMRRRAAGGEPTLFAADDYGGRSTLGY